MAFQLSPGVNVTERDLTLIVPAVATTSAGLIGVSQWGPADEVVIVTDEKDFIEKFGVPAFDADYARYWFTGANFLKYGNNLKFIRLKADDDRTAVASGVGISTIYNGDSYLANFAGLTSGAFIAKYPGDLGNSLKVVILDYTPTDEADMTNSTASDDYFDLIDNFDGVPNTSVWAETVTGDADLHDEIHILVIDEDGKFTGVAGTILEKFSYLSKARNARSADGTSNYYADAVNNRSKYIWWAGHPTELQATGTGWGQEVDANTPAFKLIDTTALAGDGSVSENDRKLSFSLSGGVTAGITSGSIVSEEDIAAAYSTYFESGQEVDVALLIAGPMESATNAKVVIEVAEARKDCVAFVSPCPVSGVGDVSTLDLQDALDFRVALNISSSYGVLDSGWKLQYDSYNDRYLYVPLCADVAGTCARTDFNFDPWFSPAGFNRGQIRNTVRLAYNPGKGDRDELYKKGINPVVSFEGEGTVLFGDKTLLSRPSAFDRINVRRLFIVLEKSIATAAKFLLFEFNDEFTRAQFRQLVEPYLRDVQGRRGITDFRVVCDETNNTPQVIDSNSFVGDIYVKPTRSINFIQLNFIATPTGVSFDEIGA